MGNMCARLAWRRASGAARGGLWGCRGRAYVGSSPSKSSPARTKPLWVNVFAHGVLAHPRVTVLLHEPCAGGKG